MSAHRHGPYAAALAAAADYLAATAGRLPDIEPAARRLAAELAMLDVALPPGAQWWTWVDAPTAPGQTTVASGWDTDDPDWRPPCR